MVRRYIKLKISTLIQNIIDELDKIIGIRNNIFGSIDVEFKKEEVDSMKKLINSLKHNKEFALLVGADISINAGIPSGTQIIKILREKYPKKFREKGIESYNYSEAFNIALPGEKNQGMVRHRNRDGDIKTIRSVPGKTPV